MLFFGFPAFVVFVLGLAVCAQDGYDGMVETLWRVHWDREAARQLSTAKIIGLVFMVAGFAVAFMAVLTLERQYASTLLTRVDHQLITHGVYRLVRHPIYSRVLWIPVIALPVYSSSPWGLLVMSLMIPLFLNRIRMEEKLLTEEFGDAYRAHIASTGKLIPFVY